MTISESVYARINGLGAVFYGQAPQSQALPYLVYQEVSGVEEMTLLGSTDLVNTRIQIDAYAVTPTAAQTLWRGARGLMKSTGSDFACGAINTTGPLPEFSIDGYRYSGDFSLWHDIG